MTRFLFSPRALCAADGGAAGEAPVCAPDCPGNPDLLAKVKAGLPADEVLYDLAELYRVLATRRASRSCTFCLRASCA